MDDAKEQFARFRDSVPSRVTKIQDGIASVPDRIATMPDRIQNLSERLPTSFPRPSSSHSRSNSGSSPPPPLVRRAPALSDPLYDLGLASLASKILYRSGRDPVSGGPLLILSASAFPDASVIDYNKLLPYVLANLPGDDELGGMEDSGMKGGYSVVFFAGGGGVGSSKNDKGNRPNWAWTLQAYHLVGAIRQCLSWFVRDMEETDGQGQLGRAVRKKIKKLWVVHERAWVRILFEMMAGVVSVKFRKKVVHLNTLSDLAQQLDITELIIPPAVFLHDRKVEGEIVLPSFPPPPVFGSPPFHHAHNPPRVGENTPLPQVLVDTSDYIRRKCLNIEGILRVPPSAALLDIAKECYNRRQVMRWEDWGPHTAAGLIKLYYRSLPEPMIPQSCYDMLMTLSPPKPSPHQAERMLNDEEKEAQFQIVQSLLTAETAGLPQFSRILFLRHLLPLLALIATHQDINKMNAVNLAVCIGGSLARSEDVAADAQASAGIRKFVEIGIERLEELAPRLPVRRRKATNEDERRRSQIDPSDSPPSYSQGTRQFVNRKKVPSLTMPRWENVDNKSAVARKALPPNSAGSDYSSSPLSYSPVGDKIPTRPSSVPPGAHSKTGTQPSPTTSLPPSRSSPTAAFSHVPRKPTPPARIPSPALSSIRAPSPAPSSILPPYTPTPAPVPPPPHTYANMGTPPNYVTPALATAPASTRTFNSPPPPPPPQMARSASIHVLQRKLSTPSIFIDNKPAASSIAGRPPLRRAVSANFAARRNSFVTEASEKEKEKPVMRRVKSTIARTGGGSVRELSQLYEERAQIGGALKEGKKLW